jgi:hypothetical protein
MEILTIAQAAKFLGVSDTAARKMIGRQELSVLPGSDPIRLDAGHVEAVLGLRQADAVHDLVRRGSSAVRLARETRAALLKPHESRPLPDRRAASWSLRMSLLQPAARTLFGVASLTAVGSQDGCRWCRAADFARVLGGWGPTRYGEGFAALFGQEPCEKCGPRLYGSVMESLGVRVRAGGRERPGPRPPLSEAERELAAEWAERRAVTAAAQPVQADDGKALVARRLRTLRGRLKDARRSGDTKYALKLRAMVAELEKDAARVDGRPAVTAAAAPGRLRCGHALSAGCGCPRRGSVRR